MADESWAVEASLTATDGISPVLLQIQTNLVATQAQVDRLSQSLASMGTAAVAGSAGVAQLNTTLATAAVSATATAAGLAEASTATVALEGATGTAAAGATAMTEAVNAATKAHGGLSLATAGSTREIIVLAHEMVQGRFSRIPGSLMVLGERMGGISLSTLGWAAAIGVVTFAAYELIKNMVEAQSAINGLDAVFAFKNIPIAKDEIKQFYDQLRQLPGVTDEVAQQVIRAFASMKDVNAASMQAMLNYLQPVANEMSVKLPDAAKEMAKAFSDMDGQGDKFLTSLGASREEINQFDAALGRGDRADAFRIMLTAIAEGADRAKQNTVEEAQATNDIAAAWAVAGQDGETIEAVLQRLSEADLAKVAKDANDLAAAFKAAASAAAQGASLDQVRENMQALRDDTSKTQDQILQKEVESWQDRIAIGDLSGQNLTHAQTSLNSALAQLRRADGEAAIQQARDNLAAEEASGGAGGRNTVLQRQAATWSTLLTGDKLTADQRADIQRELNTTLATLHGTESEEQLKALERVTDATRVGSEQRIAAAEQEVTLTTKKYGEGTDQQINALKRLDEARQASTDLSNRLALQQNQADQEVARINLEGERDQLDAAVTAHRITAAQKIVLEKDYEDKLYQIELAGVDDKLKLQNLTVEEQQGVYTRLEVLAAQHQQRLDKITADGAAADEKTGKKEEQQWKQVNSEIESSATQSLDQMLQGKLKFGQAAQQLAQKLVLDEINADTKYLIQKLLFNAEGLASDEATEKGGLAVHLISENSKTAATVTGAALQSQANVAAAAIGSTAVAASAKQSIGAHAASAAAAVYDDVSQIPAIGWILAPAAAGVAFVAVEAFGSLIPSLDVGAWDVPSDMQANIHRGEMVVPANFASGIRAAQNGGGDAGSGGGGVNITFAPNVQAVDGPSVQAFFNRYARQMAATISNHVSVNPSSSASNY